MKISGEIASLSLQEQRALDCAEPLLAIAALPCGEAIDKALAEYKAILENGPDFSSLSGADEAAAGAVVGRGVALILARRRLNVIGSVAGPVLAHETERFLLARENGTSTDLE